MRIGIDLGTTNTVVSYIDENGMWKPLEFKRCGSKENPFFLPSCIAVTEGRVLVGQRAIDYGKEHYDRLLMNTKNAMGEYNRLYSVGGKNITPLQVAEYILTEVRTELANQFPTETNFNAFITVPARFREPARYATKKALTNAGFAIDERCLTDEPISAAIAYSSHLDKDKTVFVVDIGGGTFDLALIKTAIVGTATNPDNIETISWGGELFLGGNDVDELLVRNITDFVCKQTGKNLYSAFGALLGSREETQAAAVIRTLPIEIKKQLYSDDVFEATVYVSELLRDYDLNYSITRDKYMELMCDISEKLSNHIDNTFVTVPRDVGDVDHVLVVGGMAHELCLRNILESKFGKNKIIIPEDAMLLVSKGAAICNSNLSIHVENRAYSSIGLVKESGEAVHTFIKEGDIVTHGTVFDATVEAVSQDATSIIIKLAEFRGEFNKNDYNIIFNEEVVLRNNYKVGFVKSAIHGVYQFFGGVVLPKVRIKIEFTGDKILIISVEQNDGTITKLNHRLGGYR